MLNDVTFAYTTYVSIGDNNTDEVTDWGLAPAANPSLGNFAVQVSVPLQATINLTLHDVTGRIVTEYSQELPGGTHTVSFNNIAQGVYFCTMRAEEFTATERITVLK